MPEVRDYIDLCMAAKLFPGDPSASAIWRWCRKGCKSRSGERVFLKHQRSGKKLYITKQWADEFLAALASEDQKHFQTETQTATPAVRERTDAQRERDIRHAEETWNSLRSKKLKKPRRK